MKNLLFTKVSRKMAAFVFVLALLGCCITVSLAQPIVFNPTPNCFYIHLESPNIATACSGPCVNDGSACDNCYTFRIFPCSTGSLISLKMWVEDGTYAHNAVCYSACTATGYVENDIGNGEDETP